MEARALSSFIHSLAKAVQHKVENLIQEILTCAELKLHYFNSQGLSNTIWPLASLGYKDEAFIKMLIKKAEAKMIAFNPQTFYNIIWALATLNYSDRSSFVVRKPSPF